MLSGMSLPVEQRTRLLEAVLVLVGATAIAGFILVPKAGLLAVIGCTALWFVGLVGDVFRGRIDGILLWWAGVFPLGYHFASFPRERSIVMLDRVVILVVFMGLFLVRPGTRIAVPKPLRLAGLALLAFTAVAGVTLRNSTNAPYGAKNLLDSFLLTFLLGWCVIAGFDVRRRLPTLHTAVCISSIISAAVAAAEVVTGRDLLPVWNSELAFAGGIPRPNGPFESDDTLALIGTTSFFFLLFLRRVLGSELSAGRRMLHSIGLAAALGMALMPMFRSVVITLLLALIIDTFWEKRATRRGWRVMLMLASAGLIFIATVFAPEVFEDRSRPENVYGRVAQYEQSLRVFLDHPVLGVGYGNFHNFVVGESRYLASYEGVSSLDWPHNNLSQVLTETGILGFVPYVMANLLLFTAMWQLRQLGSSGRLVWKYCLYIFLSYWITGLSLGSGYSPLNLWYMFAMSVFFKYVLTGPDLMRPVEVQVPDQAFSAPARTF